MLSRNFINNCVLKRNGIQLFSLSSSSSNAAKKVNTPLADLRKKSGYSLSLCKKALTKHDQNVDAAFKWLQEQAQAQGWDKAQKLEGRKTAHGLIGVRVDGKSAAMIELNCETDFVARNKQFLSLLHEVTELNINASKDIISQNAHISKHLNKSDLEIMPQDNGKTMADMVALHIGLIGENITVNKATWLTIPEEDKNCHLIGFTHPSGDIHGEKMSYGKYGVLMALTKDPNLGQLPEGHSIESMGRQLCQHVIGMNPESVGNLYDLNTWPRSKEAKSTETNVKQVDNVDNPYGDYDNSVSDDVLDPAQKEMIHQQFLMDTDKFVREILLEAGMNIKSFVRYEVGQN